MFRGRKETDQSFPVGQAKKGHDNSHTGMPRVAEESRVHSKFFQEKEVLASLPGAEKKSRRS